MIKSLPTASQQKQLLRDFVVVTITVAMIALIFVRIWLAHEGDSAEVQQAATDGIFLMSGFFGTVLYYLGFKEGKNHNV